jgi:hypothetical protein
VEALDLLSEEQRASQSIRVISKTSRATSLQLGRRQPRWSHGYDRGFAPAEDALALFGVGIGSLLCRFKTGILLTGSYMQLSVRPVWRGSRWCRNCAHHGLRAMPYWPVVEVPKPMA